MVIAVDFDGTLCKDEYPCIGEPNTELFNSLIKFQSRGNYIILWTCRRGNMLREAVDFCRRNGLEFDGINDRPAEAPDIYSAPTDRVNYAKVFADIYIDDRAVTPHQFCISLKNFLKRT